MIGRKSVDCFFNRGSKSSKRRMIAAVKRGLVRRRPLALHVLRGRRHSLRRGRDHCGFSRKGAARGVLKTCHGPALKCRARAGYRDGVRRFVGTGGRRLNLSRFGGDFMDASRIRKEGIRRDDLDRQYESLDTTSPPARVDNTLKILGFTVSLMNLTEPSQKRKLQPPACRLQKSSAPAPLKFGTSTYC